MYCAPTSPPSLFFDCTLPLPPPSVWGQCHPMKIKYLENPTKYMTFLRHFAVADVLEILFCLSILGNFNLLLKQHM